MGLYLISESVSGETKTIKATTPREALIKYLEEDVEVNPDSSPWNYDFEITDIT